MKEISVLLLLSFLLAGCATGNHANASGSASGSQNKPAAEGAPAESQSDVVIVRGIIEGINGPGSSQPTNIPR